MVERILKIDPTVYFASIIDRYGQTVHESIRDKLPVEILGMRPPEQMVKNYRFQIAVITSIFKLAEDLLGTSHYILSDYESADLLIVPAKERNVSILVFLSARADAKSIATKILEELYSRR